MRITPPWFAWFIALLPSVAVADGTLLSDLHPMGISKLGECRELLEAGQVEKGLRELQSLHEDALGKPHLVPVEHAASGGLYRRYEVLESSTRSLLFSSPEYRNQYGELFGVEGRSHYQVALKSRDPQPLLRMSRRFPLLPEAWRAALTAGDLWLEQGRADMAVVAWQLFPRAGLTAEFRERFDQRMRVLASWDAKHVDAHWRQWLPKGERLPQGQRNSKGLKGSGQTVPIGDRDGGKKRSPRTAVTTKRRLALELVWSSENAFEPDRLAELHSQRSPYAARVVGGHGTVLAASALHLFEFQLTSRDYRKWRLPKSSRTYRETSRLWFPALATTVAPVSRPAADRGQ